MESAAIGLAATAFVFAMAALARVSSHRHSRRAVTAGDRARARATAHAVPLSMT